MTEPTPPKSVRELVRVSRAGVSSIVDPSDLARFAGPGSSWNPSDSVDELHSIRRNRIRHERGHPITGAPATESCGGTLYFNEYATEDLLESVARLIGLPWGLRDYAVFAATSTDSPHDRYLRQLRVIPSEVMRNRFRRDPADFAADRPQPLAVKDLVWAFIQEERAIRKPLGTLNGDGDDVYEALAFGLHLENAYHGILRVWSRAWLVEK